MKRVWVLGFAVVLAAWSLCGGATASEDLITRTYRYESRPSPPPPTDAQLSAACAHHPDRDMDGYLALFNPEPRKGLKFPPSTQGFVPKDLEIENGPLRYVSITGTAWSYDVPVVDPKFVDTAVRAPDSRISPCRVRDRAGQWWIVVRALVDQGLVYYRAEDFKREDLYYLPNSDPYVSNYTRNVTPAQPPLAAEPCVASLRPLKKYGDIVFDVRTWNDPDFKKVPAGLEIRPVAEDYVIVKSVIPRLLPGPLWYHVNELPLKTRVTSVCHVKDDGGWWWAAYRAERGYLVYLPLAELTAAKDIGAK